jgi:hypothetical protein
MNTNLKLLESPSWNYQRPATPGISQRTRIPTWESEDEHYKRYNLSPQAVQNTARIERTTKMAIFSTLGACGLSLFVGISAMQDRFVASDIAFSLSKQTQVASQALNASLIP